MKLLKFGRQSGIQLPLSYSSSKDMFASWHILPFYTIFTSIKTSGSNKNYEISHKKTPWYTCISFKLCQSPSCWIEECINKNKNYLDNNVWKLCKVSRELSTVRFSHEHLVDMSIYLGKREDILDLFPLWISFWYA